MPLTEEEKRLQAERSHQSTASRLNPFYFGPGSMWGDPREQRAVGEMRQGAAADVARQEQQAFQRGQEQQEEKPYPIPISPHTGAPIMAPPEWDVLDRNVQYRHHVANERERIRLRDKGVDVARPPSRPEPEIDKLGEGRGVHERTSVLEIGDPDVVGVDPLTGGQIRSKEAMTQSDPRETRAKLMEAREQLGKDPSLSVEALRERVAAGVTRTPEENVQSILSSISGLQSEGRRPWVESVNKTPHMAYRDERIPPAMRALASANSAYMFHKSRKHREMIWAQAKKDPYSVAAGEAKRPVKHSKYAVPNLTSPGSYRAGEVIDWWQKMVPHLGHIFSAEERTEQRSLSQKIADGTASNQDYWRWGQYMAQAKLASEKGVLPKALDVTRDLFAYMGEIMQGEMLLGGAQARAATKSLGAKVFGRRAPGILGKGFTGTPGILGKGAVEFSGAAASAFVGAAAHPTMVVRILAEDQPGFDHMAPDDRNRLQLVMGKDARSMGRRVADAMVKTYVTHIVEKSGYAMGKITGATGRALGKVPGVKTLENNLGLAAMGRWFAARGESGLVRGLKNVARTSSLHGPGFEIAEEIADAFAETLVDPEHFISTGQENLWTLVRDWGSGVTVKNPKTGKETPKYTGDDVAKEILPMAIAFAALGVGVKTGFGTKFKKIFTEEALPTQADIHMEPESAWKDLLLKGGKERSDAIQFDLQNRLDAAAEAGPEELERVINQVAEIVNLADNEAKSPSEQNISRKTFEGITWPGTNRTLYDMMKAQGERKGFLDGLKSRAAVSKALYDSSLRLDQLKKEPPAPEEAAPAEQMPAQVEPSRAAEAVQIPQEPAPEGVPGQVEMEEQLRQQGISEEEIAAMRETAAEGLPGVAPELAEAAEAPKAAAPVAVKPSEAASLYEEFDIPENPTPAQMLLLEEGEETDVDAITRRHLEIHVEVTKLRIGPRSDQAEVLLNELSLAKSDLIKAAEEERTRKGRVGRKEKIEPEPTPAQVVTPTGKIIPPKAALGRLSPGKLRELYQRPRRVLQRPNESDAAYEGRIRSVSRDLGINGHEDRSLEDLRTAIATRVGEPTEAPAAPKAAEGVPTRVYHASPHKIVGPLRPSPGRMDREATGIYFAHTPEEAVRSTPHVSTTKESVDKNVTEWDVNPKNTLSRDDSEFEKIWNEVVGKSAKAMKKMAVDSGLKTAEEFDEMFEKEGVDGLGLFDDILAEGGDGRIIPDTFTKELVKRGYDSINIPPRGDFPGWFVALDPAIVTRAGKPPAAPKAAVKPVKKPAKKKTKAEQKEYSAQVKAAVVQEPPPEPKGQTAIGRGEITGELVEKMMKVSSVDQLVEHIDNLNSYLKILGEEPIKKTRGGAGGKGYGSRDNMHKKILEAAKRIFGDTTLHPDTPLKGKTITGFPQVKAKPAPKEEAAPKAADEITFKPIDQKFSVKGKVVEDLQHSVIVQLTQNSTSEDFKKGELAEISRSDMTQHFGEKGMPYFFLQTIDSRMAVFPGMANLASLVSGTIDVADAYFGSPGVTQRFAKNLLFPGRVLGPEFHSNAMRRFSQQRGSFEKIMQLVTSLDAQWRDIYNKKLFGGERILGTPMHFPQAPQERLDALTLAFKTRPENLEAAFDSGKIDLDKKLLPTIMDINTYRDHLSDLWRQHIVPDTGLSEDAAQHAVPTEELVMAEQQLWLTRAYDVFTNPMHGKWIKKNKPELVEQFKGLLPEAELVRRMAVVEATHVQNIQKQLNGTIPRKRKPGSPIGVITEFRERWKKEGHPKSEIDLMAAKMERMWLDVARKNFKADLKPMTPEQVDEWVEEMLAPERVGPSVRVSMGRQDMTAFLARKFGEEGLSEFEDVYRELLGEEKDPIISLLRSAEKLTSMMASKYTQDRMIEMNDAVDKDGNRILVLFSDKKTEKVKTAKGMETIIFKEAYRIPDNAEFGALRGKWATEEFYKALEQYFGVGAGKAVDPTWMRTLTGGFFRVYGGGIVVPTKMAAAPYNAITHTRNFLGNAQISMTKGHFWRFSNWHEAFAAIDQNMTKRGKQTIRGKVAGYVTGYKPDLEKLRELVVDAIKRGAIGDNAPLTEIADLMKASYGSGFGAYSAMNSPSQQLGLLPKLGKLTGGALLQAHQAVMRWYQAEDDFWKMLGYISEIDMLRKAYPEWSEDQIREEAADRVRDAYPTGTNAGEWVKSVRWFPVTGAFPTWWAEYLRTQLYAMPRQAFKDINSGNKVLKQHGTNVLLRYTQLAGWSYGLKYFMQMLISKAFGWIAYTDDEVDDNRHLALPWNVDDQLSVFDRGKGKKPLVVAWSTWMPASRFADVVEGIRLGETKFDKAWNVKQAALNDFLGEELLWSSITQAVQNRRPGREGPLAGYTSRLFNPQDEDFNTKQFQHAFKGYKPGFLRSLQKMNLGPVLKRSLGMEVDNIEEEGDTFGLEVVKVVTGLALMEQDTELSSSFRIGEFHEKIRDLGTVANNAMRRPTVSVEEFKEKLKFVDMNRRMMYEHMYTMVRAMKRGGMEEEQIADMFRERFGKGPTEDIVYNGHKPGAVKYTPYMVSKATYNKAYAEDPELADKKYDAWDIHYTKTDEQSDKELKDWIKFQEESK